MALKMAQEELQSFVPEAERDSENPTKVWAVPLNAKGYEKYTDSLMETRGARIKSRVIKATEEMIRKTVRRLENIYNYQGILQIEVTDPDQFVQLLMGLQDVNAYNEIINWLKGISLFSEEELKNLPEPQDVVSSPALPEKKKAQ